MSIINKTYQRIKQVLIVVKRLSMTDVMILCGTGFLFYGIYKIYPPASYIFVGLLLIAWAVFIEYNSTR